MTTSHVAVAPPSAPSRTKPVSPAAKAGRPAWMIYAIAIPAAILAAEVVWLVRDPLTEHGMWILALAYRWIGPMLAAPFAALLLFELSSIWGLVRRRRIEPTVTVRLSAGARLEFVVAIAPVIGLLGTVLGFASYFDQLGTEKYGGLVSALGTTALGMSMVAVGQTARVVFSNAYRHILNEKAGEPTLPPVPLTTADPEAGTS